MGDSSPDLETWSTLQAAQHFGGSFLGGSVDLNLFQAALLPGFCFSWDAWMISASCLQRDTCERDAQQSLLLLLGRRGIVNLAALKCS